MSRRQFIICLVAVFLVSATALSTRKPCRKLQAEYGYVCVCDDNYCDTLDVPEPNAKEYILVTSSESGDRFSYKKGKLIKPKNVSKVYLEIDPSDEYQEIKGFGGGYTGAVTYLVDKISANLRNCLYNSYFSQSSGMAYTRLRISIGGTDFDISPWAYNEYPQNDTKLSNFTKLDERDLMRNRQLKELAQISGNKKVKYLAAAWSPPIWMKANKKWYGLANNQIFPEYYQTWANYHVRWLELMQNDGMNIGAISTGNEPIVGKQNFLFEETMWNITKHAKWIAENLGPTIRNSKFSDIEIHGFDDSRKFVNDWVDEMQKVNPDAFDYLSAIQFHGYTDNSTNPEILDEIQSKFSDKDIWYTEMCFGVKVANPPIGGPRLGMWSRAEELIKIMFENFLHSTNGWYDWNLIVDEDGGPNNALGGLGVTDAPIILNKNLTVMYKQPMFYVLAHFSKFITPGSVRIDARLEGADQSVVQYLAFKRPDKKIAVFLYNNSTQQAVDLNILDNPKKGIEITLNPKSLNTLIYSNGNVDTTTSAKQSGATNIFIIPSIWS
ncbi:lysosomal acid glucosylceramidase-like [Sitodiplosis mosellana]|uniref:lysosomal acid glucosylceramidase-like n=1 Tax=Sitodiplosis mosellana TaxID=263140 RepID=UPI0024446693|nr:lysosomal acid glucosylceramidase-like [Sitodiplosis mosellana]